MKTFKNVPVIGLIKGYYPNYDVFITPTIIEVNQLLELGVQCIASDCTNRLHPDQTIEFLINYIRTTSPDTVIMGDCATLDDIKLCNELNLDLVSTTLHGYTVDTQNLNNTMNNYEFIRTCLENTHISLIAEGGIWEPREVKELINLGCHSVVVGSAITRPKEITKRFLRKMRE